MFRELDDVDRSHLSDEVITEGAVTLAPSTVTGVPGAGVDEGGTQVRGGETRIALLGGGGV